MDWQPIDTAPRDGTAFLIHRPARQGYFARQDVEVAFWDGSDWQTIHGAKLWAYECPHWMPLPAPPSA